MDLLRQDGGWPEHASRRARGRQYQKSTASPELLDLFIVTIHNEQRMHNEKVPWSAHPRVGAGSLVQNVNGPIWSRFILWLGHSGGLVYLNWDAGLPTGEKMQLAVDVLPKASQVCLVKKGRRLF